MLLETGHTYLLGEHKYCISGFLGSGAVCDVFLAAPEAFPDKEVIVKLAGQRVGIQPDKLVRNEGRVLRILNQAEGLDLFAVNGIGTRIRTAQATSRRRRIIALYDEGQLGEDLPFLIQEKAPPELESPPVNGFSEEARLFGVGNAIVQGIALAHHNNLALKDFEPLTKFDRLRLRWLPDEAGAFDLKIIDWNITGGPESFLLDLVYFGMHLFHLLSGRLLPVAGIENRPSAEPDTNPGWMNLTLGSQQIIERLLQAGQGGYERIDDVLTDMNWYHQVLSETFRGVPWEGIQLKAREALRRRRIDQASAVLFLARRRGLSDDEEREASNLENQIVREQEKEAARLLFNGRESIFMGAFDAACTELLARVEQPHISARVKDQAQILLLQAQIGQALASTKNEIINSPVWKLISAAVKLMEKRQWLEAAQNLDQAAAVDETLKEIRAFQELQLLAKTWQQVELLSKEFQEADSWGDTPAGIEGTVKKMQSIADELALAANSVPNEKEFAVRENEIRRRFLNARRLNEQYPVLVDQVSQFEIKLLSLDPEVPLQASTFPLRLVYEQEKQALQSLEARQQDLALCYAGLQQVSDLSTEFPRTPWLDALKKRLADTRDILENKTQEAQAHLDALAATRGIWDQAQEARDRAEYKQVLDLLSGLTMQAFRADADFQALLSEADQGNKNTISASNAVQIARYRIRKGEPVVETWRVLHKVQSLPGLNKKLAQEIESLLAFIQQSKEEEQSAVSAIQKGDFWSARAELQRLKELAEAVGFQLSEKDSAQLANLEQVCQLLDSLQLESSAEEIRSSLERAQRLVSGTDFFQRELSLVVTLGRVKSQIDNFHQELSIEGFFSPLRIRQSEEIAALLRDLYSSKLTVVGKQARALCETIAVSLEQHIKNLVIQTMEEIKSDGPRSEAKRQFTSAWRQIPEVFRQAMHAEVIGSCQSFKRSLDVAEGFWVLENDLTSSRSFRAVAEQAHTYLEENGALAGELAEIIGKHLSDLERAAAAERLRDAGPALGEIQVVYITRCYHAAGDFLGYLEKIPLASNLCSSLRVDLERTAVKQTILLQDKLNRALYLLPLEQDHPEAENDFLQGFHGLYWLSQYRGEDKAQVYNLVENALRKWLKSSVVQVGEEAWEVGSEMLSCRHLARLARVNALLNEEWEAVLPPLPGNREYAPPGSILPVESLIGFSTTLCQLVNLPRPSSTEFSTEEEAAAWLIRTEAGYRVMAKCLKLIEGYSKGLDITSRWMPGSYLRLMNDELAWAEQARKRLEEANKNRYAPLKALRYLVEPVALTESRPPYSLEDCLKRIQRLPVQVSLEGLFKASTILLREYRQLLQAQIAAIVRRESDPSKAAMLLNQEVLVVPYNPIIEKEVVEAGSAAIHSLVNFRTGTLGNSLTYIWKFRNVKDWIVNQTGWKNRLPEKSAPVR